MMLFMLSSCIVTDVHDVVENVECNLYEEWMHMVRMLLHAHTVLRMYICASFSRTRVLHKKHETTVFKNILFIACIVD